VDVFHREISNVFEDLSQSLRVLLESHYKTHVQGLINVDRAEAVGNVEVALTSVLNSFHSLSDATKKEKSLDINWYGTPELAFVLAIRNARHHNLSNKISPLYNFHVQESEDPGRLSQYILVDFPSNEEGGDTFEVYLSWKDIESLLNLPQKVTHFRPEMSEAIRQYLNTEQFKEYGDYYQLSTDRIFINVVPLLVNAGLAIVPKIANLVKASSTESEYFLWHFQNIEKAETKKHEVNCGPIATIN
jgi:hypothetical protein